MTLVTVTCRVEPYALSCWVWPIAGSLGRRCLWRVAEEVVERVVVELVVDGGGGADDRDAPELPHPATSRPTLNTAPASATGARRI